MAFTIERKTVPSFGIKAGEMRPTDLGIVIRCDNYQKFIGHYVFMTHGVLVSLTDGSYWNEQSEFLEEAIVNDLTVVELTLRIEG